MAWQITSTDLKWYNQEQDAKLADNLKEAASRLGTPVDLLLSFPLQQDHNQSETCFVDFT
jgi:hypothetical protein